AGGHDHVAGGRVGLEEGILVVLPPELRALKAFAAVALGHAARAAADTPAAARRGRSRTTRRGPSRPARRRRARTRSARTAGVARGRGIATTAEPRRHRVRRTL